MFVNSRVNSDDRSEECIPPSHKPSDSNESKKLSGSPASASAPPRPVPMPVEASRDTSHMRARVTSSHFVGRTGELGELDLALREAQGGCPAVVLLSGESGVGKTRLVREFE